MVIDSQFVDQLCARLRRVMLKAKRFTDWPVSHKYPLRHVVIDGIASVLSSKTVTLNIARGVIVNIIVG